MREIISLHIGQAGVRIGDACWQLYCLEHGLDPDGTLPPPISTSERKYNHFDYRYRDPEDSMYRCFFEEERKTPGTYKARTLLLDFDHDVVNEIRTGTYRQLFHPDQLVSGKQNTSSNYAAGHYGMGGKEMLGVAMDRIRRLADSCSGLQGFLIHHSIGGGTGSGFCSLLQEQLSVEFGKKLKANFTIMPSPNTSPVIVEPYNYMLSTKSLLEHSDVCHVLENDAIYNSCRTVLDIERPTYGHLNELVSHLAATVTSSMRYDSRGAAMLDLSEFQTSLVPYPRIHFLVPGLAPLLSVQKCYYETPTVSELSFNALIDPSHRFVQCNPQTGKYMSSYLLYRGDVVPKDIHAAVYAIKSRRTLQFVDWCPCSFKFGLSYNMPATIPGSMIARHHRAVCSLSNNTCVTEVFSRLNYKFDLLFSKRAFVHWYVAEGLEEGEFAERREDMVSLEKDYEEIAAETLDDEDDEGDVY